MTEINSLSDLRPGDLMFGPIGGAVGLGVGLGQLLLGEAFRAGKTSVRHVGIVVEGAYVAGPMLPARAPRLVQAMPGGAEEIEMNHADHWTERNAYVRLPEDYPGQAEDAAAVARLMVEVGVSYSFASYGALILRRWGARSARLDSWIGRRRPPVPIAWPGGRQDAATGHLGVSLPVEAICSVLYDQAWTLTGKKVMLGATPQVVTPGALAVEFWRRYGQVSWAFPRAE